MKTMKTRVSEAETNDINKKKREVLQQSITKQTQNCPSYCGDCPHPPKNPKYSVGDILRVDSSNTGGHGKKIRITQVTKYCVVNETNEYWCECVGETFGYGFQERDDSYEYIGRDLTLMEFIK